MSKQRPELKGLLQENTTAIEYFQNTVIRPVIKMQHHFLIHIFKQYLLQKKVSFLELSKEKQVLFITSATSKDLGFRQFLLGSVVGHFSETELLIYYKNEKDYKKRILTIITQRYKDSLQDII